MTRRVSKRIRSAALCAALATTLAACSGVAHGPTSGAGPAYRLTTDTPTAAKNIDSFSWSLYAEPLSLDYAWAFDYPPNQVLANVCESLLRWNPDLTVSPGLAEKFANPTPTTWVYTIRQGVTFHDGSPLTPADVVASLRRHLDPRVGSFWASSFVNVKSIAQTGARQVTVTLRKPDSLFNQFMAVTPGTIESAATLARAGKAYGTPGSRRRLHRPLQPRFVEAGGQPDPQEVRRVLGQGPRGEVPLGQVRLPQRPHHPGQCVDRR